MSQAPDFTQGKIYKPLIKFTLPILFAILIQALYGAVDLLIVGQFGDKSSVSGVATGSQIMHMVTGIITGISMGTTILLAKCIGSKDSKGASVTIGNSILIFSIIAIVLTAIMTIFSKSITTLLNVPESAFKKASDYVFICSCGIILIVAYNLISSIFRGMGNSTLPLLFVGIACITNIIADLILVGTFKLDAVGAAIATVFAQGISVLLSLIIIRKKQLIIKISKQSFSINKDNIKSILSLGLPIALQDALTNISFLIITAIINTIGLVESAAIGVSEKIVVFIMLIPMSFMSSVSTFSAQNIGANKPERAKKALYYSIITGLSVGILMFLFAFFKGNLLAMAFSKESEVVASTALYMKAYAIDCVLVCILFSIMGFLNGIGKTFFVMMQGLLAAFVIRIPFSYFASKITNTSMFKIGLASPVATAFSIILCIIYYIHIIKVDSNNINNNIKTS